MSRLRFALSLWASAFAACFVLFMADWLWTTHAQLDLVQATVGRLTMLALVGSIFGVMTLAAAIWARKSATRTKLSIVVAVLISVWPATRLASFLLSGAKWAAHPRRELLVWAGTAILLFLGSAGWAWIVRGAVRPSSKGGRREFGVSAAWATVSIAVIVVYLAAAQRFRVYEYVFAWTLPALIALATSVVWRLEPARARALLVTAAIMLAIPMVAPTQWNADKRATGKRSVAASTRLGAIADAYLVPALSAPSVELRRQQRCPPTREEILTAPIPVDSGKRRNVILISIDAVRQDMVDQDANGRAVAPNLRKLFSSGVRFARASSTYPATLYAFGSAFTSWTPAELYMAPSLPPTIFTLAAKAVDRAITEIQDDRWFRLDAVQDFLLRDAGAHFSKPEPALTEHFIERLAAARADGESVLAWIHYFTPHDPYTPRGRFFFGKGKRNDYYSEVALVDAEIAKLFDYLRRDAWFSDSLIVVFSDHGEALGERNYWGHHVYLNRWMMEIPFLLIYPGASSRTVTTRVSLLDLAPTVLHFLGIPISSEMQGESLFVLPQDDPNRASVAEAFPMRHLELFEQFRLRELDDEAIRARLRTIHTERKGYEPKVAVALGDYRLIRHRSSGTDQLFDQQSDPTERWDLKRRGRATPTAVVEALNRWESEQLGRISCRLWGGSGATAYP